MKIKTFWLVGVVFLLFCNVDSGFIRAADRPVLIQTYAETFENFNIDKPYRWETFGDVSALVLDKVKGFIGIQNPAGENYGWVSPLVGKGGASRHDINYSRYHKKNPERFPKTYQLKLRVQTVLSGSRDYFLVKLRWYNDDELLEETEYPIKRGYRSWKSLEFKGKVPPRSNQYQILLTGTPRAETAESFSLLVDELCMKILIEDQPVEFPPDEQLRQMKINFPLNVREFHVWWHTPWHPADWVNMYEIDPRSRSPFSGLWDKTAWYVKRDYWQRDISSRQYPMIGPYDGFDREVIKWQIQTMKNTGLDGAFINLWPNRAENRMGYGSSGVIFDRIIDVAEECDFKVALYDENYSHDVIANAARLVIFFNKYKDRKGYYRINGQPAIWMQNFQGFLPHTPQELKQLINYVEEQLETDLYWVISLIRFNWPIHDRDEFLAMEEIDCVDFRYAVEEIAKNQETGEISWYAMSEGLKDFLACLKSAPVKHDWSASVSPAFDLVDDYTRVPQVLYNGYIMTYQRRNHGLMFLKILHLISQQEIPPAFITIKSWNDYHEGHSIEPAYYYEGDRDVPLGQNQNPYFYTELVADVLSKSFTPAALPAADHVDPLIRPLLYPEHASEDVYGPLFTSLDIKGDQLRCEIRDYHTRESRLFQDELPAAGFRVESTGKVKQWGLELGNLAWFNENQKIVEVAGQKCLKVYDTETIQLRVGDEIISGLAEDSRLFVVLSYYDLKTNEGRNAAIQINYMTNDGVRIGDRRIRVYNNAIWQWGIQCLYNTDFKRDNRIEISSRGSELLVHSLYLVIPDLSKKTVELKPVSRGRYVLELQDLSQALSPDKVAVLYPQDGNENYGNLIVVDTEKRKIIPDITSVVTDK